MSPEPQHGTPSGDAVLALGKYARDTGQDTQDVYLFLFKGFGGQYHLVQLMQMENLCRMELL